MKPIQTFSGQMSVNDDPKEKFGYKQFSPGDKVIFKPTSGFEKKDKSGVILGIAYQSIWVLFEGDTDAHGFGTGDLKDLHKV